MLRFFLITLGTLIVLSMAFYAARLWLKIYRHNRQVKHQIKQAQAVRFEKILESVEIIAKAMLSEQCDLSEGVLRLKPLLDVLGQPLNRFAAMWALYETVQDMPILEARKQLKRNERMKFDLEREAKEVELAEQIKQELGVLLVEMKG